MSTAKKICILLLALTSTAAVWMLNRPHPLEPVSSLQIKIESLQTENIALSARVENLSRERQTLDAQVSTLQNKISRLLPQIPAPSTPETAPPTLPSAPKGSVPAKNTFEGETPFATAVLSLASRAAELNHCFVRMPDKEIPEIQFLDEGDWLHLAKNANLDSPEGVRKALADARQQAKARFAPMLTSALAGFFKANNAQPPISMEQLKPFFPIPVDDATLARYQITTDPTGKQTLGSATTIQEIAAVDPLYDSHFQIGISGWSASTISDSYSEKFK